MYSLLIEWSNNTYKLKIDLKCYAAEMWLHASIVIGSDDLYNSKANFINRNGKNLELVSK